MGSLALATESRAVAGFQRIELLSAGSLEIRQGSSESLSITAEGDVLPGLVSEVVDGTLKLSARAGASLRATKGIRYFVTVKNLSALSLAGAGQANVIELRSDALAVTLSGAGDVTLIRLDARSLVVALRGQGAVTVSGRATRQQLTLSGAGTYNGRELASSEATVVLSGTGSIQVSVQQALDATTLGCTSSKTRRRLGGRSAGRGDVPPAVA